MYAVVGFFMAQVADLLFPALQADLGDGWRALHDFPAIGNLGLAYALQGEWDRAIEMVLISIRRDPTRSYIDYANLAAYAVRLSLFDWAGESANQSLELRPDNAIALGSLALSALFRGRTAEAVERAVELGWNEPDLTGRDPILASLREEPRFAAAVERMQARTDAMRDRVERQRRIGS